MSSLKERRNPVKASFLYVKVKSTTCAHLAPMTEKMWPILSNFYAVTRLRSFGDEFHCFFLQLQKRQQFPELIGDINFPPFFDEKKFFSSVFRISSNELRLWTHYDVIYVLFHTHIK